MDILDINNLNNTNIIKSFEFCSEGIILLLHIKKETYRGVMKMFIDADIILNNDDIVKQISKSGSSIYTSLIYKESCIFWIGTNDWKGLRWKNFKNETKIAYYGNLTQMKEKYIEQRMFITFVSNYFYDSIKQYKNLKLLFETNIDEINDNYE